MRFMLLLGFIFGFVFRNYCQLHNKIFESAQKSPPENLAEIQVQGDPPINNLTNMQSYGAPEAENLVEIQIQGNSPVDNLTEIQIQGNSPIDNLTKTEAQENSPINNLTKIQVQEGQYSPFRYNETYHIYTLDEKPIIWLYWDNFTTMPPYIQLSIRLMQCHNQPDVSLQILNRSTLSNFLENMHPAFDYLSTLFPR